MKYFIYARKSTDDEDRQILSIEAQLVELRQYAVRESLTVVTEYVVSDNIIRPKTNNAGASLIPEPPTQIIPIF